MPRVDVVGGEIQISSIGPQKRIPDMKFTGIEGNLRAWSVNPGAWWSDINVPDSILGKIHVEIHNSGLNDQVQGNLQLLGIKLGPEIRNLLPPPAVPTWDSFAPGGTMDVDASLVWDPAKEPPLQIEGDAQLHDVSVKLPMLPASAPTALTDIRGRVAFNLKEINAQGVTGKYGEAPFVITSGFASLEKDGPFELAGSAYGCKVEGLFKEMVPQEGLDQIPAWLKEYLLDAKISGQVDGSFKLSRAKGAKEVQSGVEVSARDLTLSHSRFGYPLILNVSFRYGGNALSFSQASARWGGARIEMPPTTFNFAEGAARDFSVRVSNLELDRKLHDLLPASITQQLDESAVGGIVDVDFHLERAEGAAAQTHTRTLVYLRDGRMAYVDFPYPVEHLFGRVEILDDELKGAEFSGMNGPSQIGVTIEKGKYKEMPGRLADHSRHGRRAQSGRPQRDAAVVPETLGLAQAPGNDQHEPGHSILRGPEARPGKIRFHVRRHAPEVFPASRDPVAAHRGEHHHRGSEGRRAREAFHPGPVQRGPGELRGRADGRPSRDFLLARRRAAA